MGRPNSRARAGLARVSAGSRGADRHPRSCPAPNPVVIADAGVEACGPAHRWEGCPSVGDLDSDSRDFAFRKALHRSGAERAGRRRSGTLSLSVPVRLVAETRSPAHRTAAATSLSAGTRAFQQPGGPASVGVTLRVVRLRRAHAEAASPTGVRPRSGSRQEVCPRHGRAAPRKLRLVARPTRRKGVEVGKVRFGHCSVFRTTCFSNDGLSERGDQSVFLLPSRPVNSRPFDLENIICNIAGLGTNGPTVSAIGPRPAWACSGMYGPRADRHERHRHHPRPPLDAWHHAPSTPATFYGMGHNEMLIAEGAQRGGRVNGVILSVKFRCAARSGRRLVGK